MATYKVETSDLKTSGSALEEKNAQYVTTFGKLYAETTDLKVTWQGQSSDTFNSKVESYRASFEELSKIVTSYIEFLRKAAANYEATEQALTDAANRLAGSN